MEYSYLPCLEAVDVSRYEMSFICTLWMYKQIKVQTPVIRHKTRNLNISAIA